MTLNAEGNVRSVAFSPKGRYLASFASEWDQVNKRLDNISKVWDLESDRETVNRRRPVNSLSRGLGVGEFTFSPDGKRVICKATHDTIEVLDTASGQTVLTLRLDDELTPAARARRGLRAPQNFLLARFSPDGGRIVTLTSNSTIKVWDSENGDALHTLNPGDQVTRFVFSPEGKLVVSGRKSIKVWHSGALSSLLTLDGSNDWSVMRVDMSGKDMLVLAKNDSSGSIRLTRLGRAKHTILEKSGKADLLASKADHARFAAATEGATLMVWDAGTGHQTLSLEAQKGSVHSAVFTHDGRRIISGYNDGSLKVWEEVTGLELLQLKEHTDVVRVLALSPDGKLLVSGSDDGTLKVWDASKHLGE